MSIGSLSYRKDIDGLRAFAVLAVILFHFGFLKNGYLGVDVFFVISGYLITRIIFEETVNNRFSIIQFYLRRIRRIIPLVLFTGAISFLIGLIVMLPNDLENLSQSVIATNFFINNILLLITTRDYWNLVNEYKPLMHTWSLAIEEQFYLLYPIIFIVFSKNRKNWILPVLVVLTAASFWLFIFSTDEAVKFYSLQYRFFELSLGGLAAITYKEWSINSKFKLILIVILFVVLFSNIILPSTLKLVIVVLASIGIILSRESQCKMNRTILENKVVVNIGRISFSLYMWHQIVLAYTRYFLLDVINLYQAALLLLLIIILSIITFFLIEEPFRNQKIVPTKKLLLTTGLSFVIITIIPIYIYSKAGVLKDVPELGIIKADIKANMDLKINMHVDHNEEWRDYSFRIFNFDRDFTKSDKIKVLVIGNSFARDWANILLESEQKNNIELSYIPDTTGSLKSYKRLTFADYIFFSAINKDHLIKIAKNFEVDTSKVWNVGVKNFGLSNGVFYNKPRNSNYCIQRTIIKSGVSERNKLLKKQWGSKYIDLITLVIDEYGKVPVFTPDCKFISPDGDHLTQYGAIYFGELINQNPQLTFK